MPYSNSDLFSQDNASPVPLPVKYRYPSGPLIGQTVTSLHERTEEFLATLGFVLAGAKPSFDAQTEHLGWGGSAWTVGAGPSAEVLAQQQAAAAVAATARAAALDALGALRQRTKIASLLRQGKLAKALRASLE